MVGSPDAVAVEFHNVIIFHCYTLIYFNTLLARYTEVNATLNNLFTWILEFEELLIENENIYEMEFFRLTMSV